MPTVTTIESWTLDGLALTSGNFTLMELTADPPQERQDWISAADSEAATLFRQPLHENRTITMKVRVTPQASMDAALDQVAALVTKLRKASSTSGISLVWTPTDSSRSVTFTVLTGQITGLPIALSDDGVSWLLHRPILTVELTCTPYWQGSETLTSTSSSSTPFVAFEIASVTGDIPALGRLIVTDTATQSRRHVEWGLEGPLTYNSGTSLLVDSDDMVTSGFSGTQTTATGAYDPNASGNSTLTLTPIAGATTAMAGTGNLSHVGVFRVKARMQSGSLSNLIRLSWKAADGPMNHNAWTTPISTAGWFELDLGTITVPAVTLGTQRWTGQVEVQAAASSPGTVLLDYMILIPQADGYGKARAQWSLGTGLLNGYDAFVGTTAGGALNTRTAPLGGSWATSGDTTDFVFDDSGVLPSDNVECIRRSTNVSETTGRFAILGSTSYTDTQIDARGGVGTAVTAGNAELALVSRWTDSSNHLRLVVAIKGATGGTDTVALEQVVAGSVTTLATTMPSLTQLAYYRFRLITYASGRAIGQVFSDAGTLITSVDASSSVLATGGTLASGKPGVRDRSRTTSGEFREISEIQVTTPAGEPVALYGGKSMQIRYDDTLRQDSTGTYYGRPPSYRGSRFLVPVGTSRVLVKARRNDIETALDDQVTDATQIQIGWTPRGLAVPR